MAIAKKTKHVYEYPRPALTVDVVLATREERSRVLLIRRKNEPFAGKWALPGGFVDEGETLIEAAQRELDEETSIKTSDLEQLYAAGDPGRDPRGWTVSIVFLGRVDAKAIRAKAGDDAAEVGWFPLDELPETAFDHKKILERAQARLIDRKP